MRNLKAVQNTPKSLLHPLDEQCVDSGTENRSQHIAKKYKEYSRPGLGSLMEAIRMDITFHRASGNYLYHYDGNQEVPVLDMLGGYGACIFGHNYPPFKKLLSIYLKKDTPFLAQASCRSNTALLGEKLDEMLNQRTGNHYVSLVLNTGADAVEACLKHSEMLTRAKHNEALDFFQAEMVEVRRASICNRLSAETATYRALEANYGIKAAELSSDVLEQWETAFRKSLNTPTARLALKYSYHGKTLGALKLTHGSMYRSPFNGLGPTTEFLAEGDTEALDHAVKRHRVTCIVPKVVDGLVSHTTVCVSCISSMFIEPIQGEGGIREISPDYLRACRRKADSEGFQLVFDEVQTGMGRTGTFLHSEKHHIAADVYLMSKSLGGGLVKISAACFDASKYDPKFDRIHSSTFAEDDLSSGIALAAIREIDEQHNLMSRASYVGDYLLAGLKALKRKSPAVLKDVRGVGLMLGLEFRPQLDSDSLVMRLLCEKGLFGHVLSGYLLHEHQIRIGATLSDNLVLRVEPSFFLTDTECDLFISSIDMLLNIIEKANGYELIKYMIGKEAQSSQLFRDRRFISCNEIADYRGKSFGCIEKFDETAQTVAFVGTTVCPLRFAEVDTSLQVLSKLELADLSIKIADIVGDVHLQTSTITSATGAKINFRLSTLLFDPEYITKKMHANDTGRMIEAIDNVMREAIQRKDQVLGLGTYTSILTRNGTSLITDSISLTSGNALTVGMGVESIIKSADRKKFNLSESSLAVIGAGGNIGSVYSEILADFVPRIIMLGRENRLDRIRDVAIKIYNNAAVAILAGSYRAGSVASKIVETDSWQVIKNRHANQSTVGAQLYDMLNEELKERAPIIVTSEMEMLKHANLVLSASNAPSPVIHANMLGEHECVICDISVPEDVHPDVIRSCKSVEVIRGGLVALPKNPNLSVRGNNVLGENGLIYACMAETILLGLEGIREHGSYGQISRSQVYDMLALAKKHGFKLARIKVDNVFQSKKS